MTRIMRDSTTPTDIPIDGTDLAAGYINGQFKWSPEGFARFPGAKHVHIDVDGTNPEGAGVVDCETGDVTVPGAVTKECVSRPTDSGLCGDVAQVRVGEECPDESRAFLEPSQGADGLGFEVLLAGDAGLADPVVLDVLPDPFVGVELG